VNQSFGHDEVRRRLLQGLAALSGAIASSSGRAQTPQTPPQVSASPAGVDPRQFGARVDGVSDDSDALRAAAQADNAILIKGPMRVDQVVDLPYSVALIGSGVHRSRIVVGPKGKLRISGESFDRRGGGAIIRDLTISPVDKANDDHALEMRHVHHNRFENVTFYLTSLLFDDHHYVTFRDCYFFGEPGKSNLVSNCRSQPKSAAAISECPIFSGCFFAAHPVLLEDTVGARFTDCVFFTGPFSIRSMRKLARGSNVEPFFMGPVVSGCVFDSVKGPALDIEGGGTDCRIINNFFSVGRGPRAPGVVLTASSGVELIGNRFEWCGGPALALTGCEKVGVVGNSFANMAGSPAISARRSREVRVVGNAFENRPRWGGSAEGFTTLAIDCEDGSCPDWVVTANTASGLRDPRVARLQNGIVRDNIGWPLSTEQGWPAGESRARPRGVGDGFRWYDRTLGQWLHWHQASGKWRDQTGRVV